MKNLMISIIVMFVLSLISCGGHNKIPYRQSKKIWKCSYELGRYDTSSVIRENFLKGTTTIVYLQDDSCVVIWGKKCKFRKNEILYAKAEWWATPPGGAHWKYFLVNDKGTIRYSLLNRR